MVKQKERGKVPDKIRALALLSKELTKYCEGNLGCKAMELEGYDDHSVYSAAEREWKTSDRFVINIQYCVDVRLPKKSKGGD